MIQKLAVLGSTGSIGCQTLDIVRRNPERFEATVLTANGSWLKLVEQAREFVPDSVVIADRSLYENVAQALADLPIKVYAGADAMEQVASGGGIDTVVNALVGYAGLAPTLAALKAGKKLALANKESLVVAGETVMKMAVDNRVPILPIDSEHSAIFQCLIGETSPMEKLILTASGGPFLNMPAPDLANVTVKQALAHPNWSMGAKITIDSASMMNKGFEVIEARWLFGIEPERIEVIIHPQSVIHSMVEYADGAVKAQLGTPDMHVPIQYALTFPERIALDEKKLDLVAQSQLTFMAVDRAKFPNLELAYDALRQGGNCACALNAANEVAVAAFLAEEIGFTDITRILEYAIERADVVKSPTMDDYRQSDAQSRAIAREWVESKK